ncbi:hypothetical protein G5V58_00180 [Nocardioides anomalus]|uniref:SRPBCC family protein n=1 Tax=Nocardioides anomalus TaxID=2712223 RepID=A0A6G6W844_9ACTN|nr:SRPBCC family protein [Nocardioides anomalus]QIG41394.1 hypothetical protein G5V58_00180 [Nocardioides anomalus]
MSTRFGREIAVRSSIALDHPADAVVGLVLDWGHDDLWRGHVRAVTCTPRGRAHAGQGLVEELGFAGLTFVTPTRVGAAGDRSATYAGGGPLVRVRGGRVVRPTEDGCVVDVTTVLRLGGWLRLLGPVLVPAYRRAQHGDLERLRWLVGTLHGPQAVTA